MMCPLAELPLLALGMHLSPNLLRPIIIFFSIPVPGRLTTSSVLVQIVRVFHMRLQGMNDQVIGKRKLYINVVDCAAG